MKNTNIKRRTFLKVSTIAGGSLLVGCSFSSPKLLSTPQASEEELGMWVRISTDNKIYRNQKVTAFAGIAYPEKFYSSLTEEGAILEKKISYPDHHIFDENDMLNLAENANLTKSVLVTTKKDFVRIPKSYRSLVSTLNGEIKFEDENLLKEILSNVIENKINDLAI